MSEYPIYYSEDGTMAWSIVKPEDVMQMPNAIEDTDPIMKFEGFVEGLKCFGLRGWLHELALFNDAELQMRSYPGWLREKVIFKFRGRKSALEKIRAEIDRKADEQL